MEFLFSTFFFSFLFILVTSLSIFFFFFFSIGALFIWFVFFAEEKILFRSLAN